MERGNNSANGEWQVVNRRRRRFPENWKTDATPNPTLAKPFTPFSTNPTYAQILLRNTPKPSTAVKRSSALRTPSPSPPSSPTSPPQPAYYVSPHSPTSLRFPPSTRFAEWRGRCFRCCRRGHTKAMCRNHLKCSKCWKEGHVGTQCSIPPLNPAAAPFHPASSSNPMTKGEPLFDDLLTGTYPTVPPMMPEGRPQIARCYIQREEAHFQELEKLERGVVFHSNLDQPMSIDEVANYAARTGLLTVDEVSVAVLPRGRYLIMLPPGMAQDTFISATPTVLWDFGYTFQPWSPLDEAAVIIPPYKVLIHLLGFPIHLWREEDVIRSVTSFGTYLGSVAHPNPASLEYWAAVVATEDLAQIPHNVAIRVGGLEHMVEISVIKWVHNLIYRPADLPPQPRRFSRPRPTPSSTGASSEEEPSTDDEDLITMSRKAIREICRGRDIESLPAQFRAVITGEDRQPQQAATRIATAAQTITVTGNPSRRQGPQLTSSSSNTRSPDLLEPQYEHLGGADWTDTQAQLVTDATTTQATQDLGKSLSSPRRISPQWPSDPQSSWTVCLREAGSNLQNSQLAPARIKTCDQARSHRLVRSPRGIIPKGVLQMRESLDRTFPRTSLQKPIMESKSALITATSSSMQTDKEQTPRTLLIRQTTPMGPQQIQRTLQSRDKKLVKEGSSTSEKLTPGDTPSTGPKGSGSNKAVRAINAAIQLLAGEVPTSDQHETLEDLRSSARLKRKSLGQNSSRPGTSKKPITADQDISVQTELQPEGYFEVRVQQAYCADLGLKCGFKSNDIAQMLADDNAERRLLFSSPTAPAPNPTVDDDGTPFQFDPNKEDELESEED